MNYKMRHSLRQWGRVLWPRELWTTPTVVTALLIFLKIMAFYVIWAMMTTFSGFEEVMTYINALMFTMLLLLPYGLGRWKTAQIILLLLLDLLLVANLMYARTYFSMIPARSYLLAGHVMGFGDAVWDSLTWYDWLFPVSTLLLALYYAVSYKRKLTRGNRKLAYCLTLLATVAASFIGTFAHGGFEAYHQRFMLWKRHACVVQAMGLPGVIIHDLQEMKRQLAPDDRQQVATWLAAQPPIPALADSIPARRNLVVVFCESLESWTIDARAEGKPIMPFLNSLTQDSTAFYASHVLTQADGGRSIDCELMMDAGLLPLLNGSFAFDCADNEFRSLAKAMRQEHGARSYHLTSGRPVDWNIGVLYRTLGFDTILPWAAWRHEEFIGKSSRIGDQSLVRQFIEKCQAQEIWPVGETAYVQLILVSGHTPYKIPPQYRDIYLSDNVQPEPLRHYLTAQNYVDGALKTLVAYLRSRPDYDSTMVVLVGDHEALGTDRDYFRSTPLGQQLVSPGCYTPLIILNSPISGRYDGIMGQIDIHPTMRQLMGLEGYPWPGMGTSLFDPTFPGVAIGAHGNLEGDTTRLTPSQLQHLRQARWVSDKILLYDLLNPQNQQQ